MSTPSKTKRAGASRENRESSIPARSRSRLHPKIRDRRVAVQRARGRRRLRIAGAALVLFILGGLAWLAVQSSFLDLDRVRVEGARHTEEAHVLQVAAVERGEPLLLVDRGAVAGRVERLPWVRDARVSFDLPGTLRIAVTERVPVVWTPLGEGAGAALVDADGVVLEHREAAPEGLPELRRGSGAPAPGERIEDAGDALAVVTGAPPAVAPRVRWVSERKAEFVLALDGVQRLLFGPARDVAAKWATLESLFEQLGDEPVYQVDIRVPTAAAVRRTPPTTATSVVTTTSIATSTTTAG